MVIPDMENKQLAFPGNWNNGDTGRIMDKVIFLGCGIKSSFNGYNYT